MCPWKEAATDRTSAPSRECAGEEMSRLLSSLPPTSWLNPTGTHEGGSPGDATHQSQTSRTQSRWKMDVGGKYLGNNQPTLLSTGWCHERVRIRFFKNSIFLHNVRSGRDGGGYASRGSIGSSPPGGPGVGKAKEPIGRLSPTKPLDSQKVTPRPEKELYKRLEFNKEQQKQLSSFQSDSRKF